MEQDAPRHRVTTFPSLFSLSGLSCPCQPCGNQPCICHCQPCPRSPAWPYYRSSSCSSSVYSLFYHLTSPIPPAIWWTMGQTSVRGNNHWLICVELVLKTMTCFWLPSFSHISSLCLLPQNALCVCVLGRRRTRRNGCMRVTAARMCVTLQLRWRFSLPRLNSHIVSAISRSYSHGQNCVRPIVRMIFALSSCMARYFTWVSANSAFPRSWKCSWHVGPHQSRHTIYFWSQFHSF